MADHESFTHRWTVAPLVDRPTAPLMRADLRRDDTIAMRRLRQQLTSRPV